jgi:undecaprenyl-diphosphatase
MTVSAVAGAVFVLLALAVAGHVRWLGDADAAISAAAYRTATAHPLWRSIMLAVTEAGRSVVAGVVAAAGCLILLRMRRWRAAVLVAVALPVTLSLRLVVLGLVARPRPGPWLAPAAGWAFPSGHTTASATGALLVVLVGWPWARTRIRRGVLIGVAGLWAAAVGVSRVALVVHWPSDVLGGWLLTVFLVGALTAAIGVTKPQARAETAD